MTIETSGRMADNRSVEAAVASDAATILLKRISWGAVFAGVVLSLITHLLLNMLGLGIGIMTIDPATGATPQASTLGIGAGVWWTVAGIIAAYVGGLVAGRLAGKPHAQTAGWHGLVTWAATTLVIFYLLTSVVGSVLGGAFRVVGNAASGLGQAAAAAAPAVADAVGGAAGGPIDEIRRQVRDFVATAQNDPQATRDALVENVARMLTGDEAARAQARDQAIDALASAANIPRDQAEARVNQWQQQFQAATQQAEQKARQAAEQTAEAVSRGALFSFVALLLGAIAGWFGGRSGTPREEIVSVATTLR